MRGSRSLIVNLHIEERAMALKKTSPSHENFPVEAANRHPDIGLRNGMLRTWMLPEQKYDRRTDFGRVPCFLFVHHVDPSDGAGPL